MAPPDLILPSPSDLEKASLQSQDMITSSTRGLRLTDLPHAWPEAEINQGHR